MLQGWISTEPGMCQACECKSQLDVHLVDMGPGMQAFGVKLRKLDFILENSKEALITFKQEKAWLRNQNSREAREEDVVPIQARGPERELWGGQRRQIPVKGKEEIKCTELETSEVWV